MNALEQSFGKSVRLLEDTFVYKFPDGLMGWRPGDFLIGQPYGWSIIETKLLTSPGNFPMSRWKANQRGFCAQVERSGGRYWLLVQFHPKRMMAYCGTDALEAIAGGTRSLKGTEDWGVPVQWGMGKWAVEAFLTRAQGELITING